jgi:hypothetical protein
MIEYRFWQSKTPNKWYISMMFIKYAYHPTTLITRRKHLKQPFKAISVHFPDLDIGDIG